MAGRLGPAATGRSPRGLRGRPSSASRRTGAGLELRGGHVAGKTGADSQTWSDLLDQISSMPIPDEGAGMKLIKAGIGVLQASINKYEASTGKPDLPQYIRDELSNTKTEGEWLNKMDEERRTAVWAVGNDRSGAASG